MSDLEADVDYDTGHADAEPVETEATSESVAVTC